jgi:hypothetical protein
MAPPEPAPELGLRNDIDALGYAQQPSRPQIVLNVARAAATPEIRGARCPGCARYPSCQSVAGTRPSPLSLKEANPKTRSHRSERMVSKSGLEKGMAAIEPWKKLPQLGPFRWSALAPWRAARVAFGVVLGG